MSQDEKKNEVVEKQPRISIDYAPGRNGKTFHIYDINDLQIVLSQKEADRIAKQIIRILKDEE